MIMIFAVFVFEFFFFIICFSKQRKTQKQNLISNINKAFIELLLIHFSFGIVCIPILLLLTILKFYI